jgi:Flp pilus assembly protein TadG
MKLEWLRNQRGSILLFTTVLVVPLMIIIGGLALDLAYYGTVDDELQRSMDAAALAGAGNLGFDSSVFGAARQAAQNYAVGNKYRAENASKQINTSTFTLNAGNTSSGNIVLGVWDGTARTFTPSLNGTFVNAVRCRYASSVPTSFLRLVGINSLATAAQATAISAPPATIPPTSCLFPIGVTQCPFQTAGNFGSQGCGQPILYVSNSNTNTAAWINPGGIGNPSATVARAAVTAAANGTSCSGSTLLAGNDVGANNGAITNVISGTGQYPGLANCNHGNGTCSGGYFIDKFNSSTTYTVHDSSGHVAYSGHGWEVTVPVISTSCPPGPINQNLQILTWSKMVITQVISHGVCAVTNHYPGNAWDSLCSSGLAGNVDGLFGYYECSPFDAPPTPIPAPRAALATRLRLVQ